MGQWSGIGVILGFASFGCGSGTPVAAPQPNPPSQVSAQVAPQPSVPSKSSDDSLSDDSLGDHGMMASGTPDLTGTWKFEKFSADQPHLKNKADFFQHHLQSSFSLTAQFHDQNLVIHFETGTERAGKKCQMDLLFQAKPSNKPCGCPLVTFKSASLNLMEDACLADIPESMKTPDARSFAERLAQAFEATYQIVLSDEELSLLFEENGGTVQLDLKKLP